jgi:hypothetical protein
MEMDAERLTAELEKCLVTEDEAKEGDREVYSYGSLPSLKRVILKMKMKMSGQS